jgi:hypothetical protein
MNKFFIEFLTTFFFLFIVVYSNFNPYLIALSLFIFVKFFNSYLNPLFIMSDFINDKINFCDLMFYSFLHIFALLLAIFVNNKFKNY